MLDRPAFPGSLPPKPVLPAAAPRQQLTSQASAGESQSTLKIILAFLAVLTLGNLGLTLYFNQPKDQGAENPMLAKMQTQQAEIAALTKELDAIKGKMGSTINSMNRLKTDQVGLSSRVSSINTPAPPLTQMYDVHPVDSAHPAPVAPAPVSVPVSTPVPVSTSGAATK